MSRWTFEFYCLNVTPWLDRNCCTSKKLVLSYRKSYFYMVWRKGIFRLWRSRTQPHVCMYTHECFKSVGITYLIIWNYHLRKQNEKMKQNCSSCLDIMKQCMFILCQLYVAVQGLKTWRSEGLVKLVFLFPVCGSSQLSKALSANVRASYVWKLFKLGL
jgi:hypothetical protein